MFGAVLENATLFLAYNHIQMLIKNYTTPVNQIHFLYDKNNQNKISLTMTQLILSGALSGAMTSFLLTPIELVKCKLQVKETFSYDALNQNNNNKKITTITNN